MPAALHNASYKFNTLLLVYLQTSTMSLKALQLGTVNYLKVDVSLRTYVNPTRHLSESIGN